MKTDHRLESGFLSPLSRGRNLQLFRHFPLLFRKRVIPYAVISQNESLSQPGADAFEAFANSNFHRILNSAKALYREKSPMTEEQPKPQDSPTEKPTPAPGETSGEETSAEETSAESAPADELPKEIELTPEIVEDEAIRNDFMLRLAVVLLALLVACTEIGETRTLVHIKTGQYLANHGVLPPRTDVFSHSAAEKPWINLSWLFDLFSAAGFAIGGAAALTVLKSILTGATFFLLLKAVKRDVPTWWASICAALALIVCSPQLTFEPQLITFLGISLTLWLVMRFQQSAEPASLWALLPVFVIWSNMDPRAYLGLIVLMLFTLGELIGMFLGRSALGAESNRNHLWAIVPLSLVAFLLHPFGWQTLLSPANFYLFEYPAWRGLMENAAGGSLHSFMPLTDPDFWRNLTLPTITALVLAATVPVTFALNWRNVTPAHALLYLGMIGIGLANSFDLAAVSLVFAALAAMNAQEWYAESFRQSYSIELSERLFSVGGRAVTALALFGVAFLAITGRLLGKTESRLGFGFEQNLANQIDELKTDLEETQIPGRGLNFSLSLGDVLIWLDQKPFIDSRLDLFARGGSESLFDQYREIADTWNTPPPEKDETRDDYTKRVMDVLDLRRQKLKEFDIDHAVVPLGPRVAQYGRLIMLQTDLSRWRLVRLSSMAGWFYHMKPEQAPDREYLNEHTVNFVAQAFQTESEMEFNQAHLSTAPTWTDELFALKARKANAPEMLLALHYKKLLDFRLRMINQTLQQRGGINLNDMVQATSMAHLAIRHAQSALKNDPNSLMAYQAVADGSMQLNRIEQEITRGQTDRQRRYYQAVVAYNQAINADPENAILHLELSLLYQNSGRFDLAARELDKFLEFAGPPENDDDEAAFEEYERRLRRLEEINSAVDRVQKEVDKFQEKDVAPRQIAGFAYQNGCVLMALKLLEQDGEFPQNDPLAQIWRLEAGRVEDAYLGLLHIESQLEAGIKNASVNQFGLSPQPKIRHYIATAALAVGDYERAIDQWTRQAEETRQKAMLDLLGSLPMVNRPVEPTPLFLRMSDDWSIANWVYAGNMIGRTPREAAHPLLNAALCHLEIGQPKKAAKLFNQILDVHPETQFRPLIAFYLGLTTGKKVEPIPPTEYIPVWDEMFAPGPAVADKPESRPKPEPATAEKPE